MRAKAGWKIEKPAKNLRPAQCRAWMQRTLAENFPLVVERFLEDATPKSCAHMRMVTELLEADVKKVARKKDPFGPFLRKWEAEDKAAKGRE